MRSDGAMRGSSWPLSTRSTSEPVTRLASSPSCDFLPVLLLVGEMWFMWTITDVWSRRAAPAAPATCKAYYGVTMICALAHGWSLHTYVYSPGLSKVTAAASSGLIRGVVQEPSSAAMVWVILPLFTQRTVVPAFTRMR